LIADLATPDTIGQLVLASSPGYRRVTIAMIEAVPDTNGEHTC
jgi:hypothetical protein